MKISVPSFLQTASKKLNSCKPPSKKSISRSGAASFASSSTDDSSSVSSRLQSTPRSVLPKASSTRQDDDVKISKRELEAVLRRLGNDEEISEDDLASLVATARADDDDDCISLRALGVGATCAGELDEELKGAFKVFDLDGDGKISAEELLGVLVAIGDEGCTIEDCRRMIGSVDTDGDGFVCFNDFARMMMVDGSNQRLLL